MGASGQRGLRKFDRLGTPATRDGDARSDEASPPRDPPSQLRAQDPAIAARASGRTLGPYRLMHRVAAGGVGEVHLALRRAEGQFRRWVAVKIIHPRGSSAEGWLELFRLEARLAARLDDPHVCAVFDFGEAQQTPYLAMEYLHGQSLDAVARRAEKRGGLPVDIAARIIADAARGLAAAHAHRDDDGELQPVVHRDVSPQNIFVLYSGITKVVDFGIARPMDERSEFTRTGEVRGKIAYMSPEQLRGNRPHPAMDLWALGVVLWEITLGRKLFRRGSDAEMVTRILTETVPPPRALRPDYPAALEAIVMRCLERAPLERYASALDLARDLEAFVSGAGSEGRDAVSEYLQTQFAEEKAARETLLRDLARGDDPPSRADADSLTVRTPRPDDRGGTDASWSAAPRADEDAWAPPRKASVTPRAAIFVTLIGLAVSLGGIGVLLARASSSSTAPRLTAAPSAQPAPAPAPAPAPTPVPAPVAVTPTPAEPSSARGTPSRRTHGAHRAEPHAAHAPESAGEGGRLTLRSSIPGTVYEGGARIGHTPLVGVELPVGHHNLRLVPDDPRETAQEVSVEIETGAESTIALHNG